jgi:hypothetical protein
MTRQPWIARLVALAFVLAPLAVHAQLKPAEAGPFMGDWALTLDGPQGAFEMSLKVKDEAGKVVGEVTSQVQPDVQKVNDVTKEAGDLVLKFASNYQGTPLDIKVSLTPDGADKAKVVFDVNGGQFSMSGTGLRAKK